MNIKKLFGVVLLISLVAAVYFAASFALNAITGFAPQEYNKLSLTDSSGKTVDSEIRLIEPDTIEITPKESSVEKMRFYGAETDKEVKVGLDDVPIEKTENGFIKVYAIDPSQLKFNNATVTAKADGGILYKCKEWNFKEQKCEGEWFKIMKLTPGEEYNFDLSASDPAFAEQPVAEIGKDTYLMSGSPINNYGTDNEINVKGDDNQRALIEFNLSSIPSAAVIQNATLELYVTNKGMLTPVINIYRINNSWTELGTTWNSRNGSLNWNTAGGDTGTIIWTNTTISNKDTWYTWNITSLAQNWINGTYPNYGIMLKDVTASSSTWGFASSDNTNTSIRPKITIIYTESIAPQINSTQIPSIIRENSAIETTVRATDNDLVNNVKIEINGMNYSMQQNTTSANKLVNIIPVTKGTFEANGVDDYKNVFDQKNSTHSSTGYDTRKVMVKTTGTGALGTVNSVKIKTIYSVHDSTANCSVHWATSAGTQGTAHDFMANTTVQQTEFDISTERNWSMSDFNNAEIHIIKSGATLYIYETWFEINYTSYNGVGSWSTIINSSNWSIGNYNYTLYANDSSGNLATSTGNLTILPRLVTLNTTISRQSGLQTANIMILNTNNEVEMNESNSENPSISVEAGSKQIQVQPDNISIREIDINDVSVINDINQFVKIDDPANNQGYLELYSIDPTSLNFTNASVTVNAATGNVLYKCKNWSFASQTCIDETWALFKSDLMPGQEYTFTLTAEDPGFLETNVTKYYLHNESSTQFTSYKLLNTSVNDTGIATSEGLEELIDTKCWNNNWTTSNFSSGVGVHGLWNFSIYGWCDSNKPTYLFAQIFKLNSSGRYNIVNTSQSADNVCADISSPGSAINWGYNLSQSALTNLSIGERVGIQICKNTTSSASGKYTYIQWEDSALSYVQIPITQINSTTAVSLVAPANNYTETNNQNVIFTYNVTSESNITNCTLYLTEPDGYVNEYANTTVTKNINQSFTVQFSYNGDFTWQINCTDSQNNSTQSELRNITVAIVGLAMSGNTTVNQDTYIAQNKPTDNYGTDSTISVDSQDTQSQRGLIQFNLSSIPANSIINSAILRLYTTAVKNAADHHMNISVYRLTSNWTESGATWNNKNSSTAWTTAGGDFDSTKFATTVVNASGTYYYWNITILVQGWVNGSWTNYGLILNGSGYTADAYKAFGSSNNPNTSRWPLLTINYTASINDTTPPAAITNLANKSAGTTWIYWNWTNPADADFNSSIIYINEINVANTSNNYYNKTGLLSGVNYTIRINTMDTSNNTNYTNVSNTARTISIPVTVINESSSNSTGTTLNTTLILIAENGTTVYNNTNLTHTSITLQSGLYTIIVKPVNYSVSQVVISQAYIGANTSKIVDFDSFNMSNTSKAFAINPYVNFTNADITLTAIGTDLFKCINWNFTSQNCTDNNWIKILDVVPGQSYTFTINATDPGFIETNLTKYYFHNESDTQYTSYKQMKDVSTDLASISSEAAVLTNDLVTCWNATWIAPNWTTRTLVNGSWNFSIYTNCSAAFASNRYYLMANITKKNSTGNFSVDTPWNGFACAAGGTATVRVWNYTLSNSTVYDLAAGDRIGTRICVEVTGGGAANKYSWMFWENNTMSNVVIPVTQYDDIPPAINFTAPTETSGRYANRRYVLVNVTANDSLSGLKNITIRLYNSTSLINSTNSTASPLFINFSVSADGIHYFNATACDNVNNCNSTETRNFTVDTITPLISIVSPSNTTYNNRTQLVNISASDTNLASRWFFNGTANVSYTTPVYVTFAENSNTLIAYANDSAGNLNSTSVVFTTDTIAPTISIVSPSNTTYNNTTILVNISSNENNIWYNWNGNNITYSLDYVTFNKGSNTLYAFANDTAGNLNLTSVTFFVNSAPSISLHSPANGTTIIDNQTVIFNFTATDDVNTTLNCSIYLDNVLNQTNSTTKNGTVTYFTINGISYTTHTWYINCSDGALINISEIRVFLITDAPPIFYSVSQSGRQYNQTQTIPIAVSVNKNSTVVANVSWPAGSQLVNLTYNGTNWNYNGTFTNTLYPGAYTVNITATSPYGSVNSTLTNFTINDVTAPFVGQVQPSEQIFKGGTVVNISANSTDYYYTNLATVKANVSWDSTSEIVNLSYNPSTDLFNGTFSNTAANGSYTVTITATDNAGNINNTVTGNFLIDAISPSFIGAAGPAAGTQYNQSQTVPLSINVSENSTVSANVSWDSTSQIVNLIYSSQWFYNSTFTNSLYPGTYNVNISATDNVGNVNSTTTNFIIKDVTAPLIDVALECSGYVIETEFNQSCNVLIAANVTDPYYNSIDKVWTNITWSSGSQIKNMTYNSTTGRYEVKFYNGLVGTYNITVYANDTSGNINSSQTSYYLNDSTPPLIININATKLNNTAVQVTWDTDEDSNSTVTYGTTTALGSSASDATLTNSHSITLNNLTYGQIYYYNVTSCDINGNCRTSGTYNFSLTDTTPPQITSYSIGNYAPVINESVLINATATDDLAVSGIFANITLPNGTVLTMNVPGYFNVTIAGRHNITIWANDTFGNPSAVVNDYFIAGQNVSVQFNVVDNTLNGIISNLTIYLAGTDKIVHEHDFTGSKLDNHATVLYDLLFRTYNDSITLKLLNVNISTDNNQTLGIDKTTFSRYKITYGINSTYASSSNATITLNYTDVAYSNEDALSVEKCSDWTFTARACNSNWVSVSAVQNKILHTFTINVTSFSAFSIKEAAPPAAPPSGVSGGGGVYEACKEKWQCSGWSACNNGITTRTCYDSNKCGTEMSKPSIASSCTVVYEKCFDGIQNQDESDVDCGGGICKACETGQKCTDNKDCNSGYCYAGACNFKEIDTSVPKQELPAPKIFSWINYGMLYALLVIFLIFLIYKISPVVIGYVRRMPEEKEIGLGIESIGRPIIEIRANAEKNFIRPIDKVFGFIPRKMAEAEEESLDTIKKEIEKIKGKTKKTIGAKERWIARMEKRTEEEANKDIILPVRREIRKVPEKIEEVEKEIRKDITKLGNAEIKIKDSIIGRIRRAILGMERIPEDVKELEKGAEKRIEGMKEKADEKIKSVRNKIEIAREKATEEVKKAEKEVRKAAELFKEKPQKEEKLSLEEIARKEALKLRASGHIKPIRELEKFDDLEVPRPSVIVEEKDVKKLLKIREKKPIKEIIEEKIEEIEQKPSQPQTERHEEIKKEILNDLKDVFG